MRLLAFMLAVICLASAASAQTALDLSRDDVHVGHTLRLNVKAPAAMTVRLDSDPPGSAVPTIVHFAAAREEQSVPIYVLDDSLRRIVTSANVSLVLSGEWESVGRMNSCIAGPDAFAPVAAWQPAPSDAARRNVLLGGAIIGIALIATTLIARHTLRWLTFAAVVVASSAFAVVWEHSALPETNEQSGAIIITDGKGFASIDVMQFFTTRCESSPISTPLPGLSHPMFADASHAIAMNAEVFLETSPRSQTLLAMLHRGQRLAVVSHDIVDDYRPRLQREGRHTPMESIARAFYPEFQILNQSSDHDRELGVVELATRPLK